MSSLIRTQQRDAIFEIILDREDKRNALNWDMMQQISQALDDAEWAYNESGARVLIIRAEGRAFSSGIDLESFLDQGNIFGENWRRNLFPTTQTFQTIFNKIEDHSLPSICVMHGYCLGMGFEMALACDFRYAADRTKFSLPETRLGIIPDVGGTTRLTKLIGPSRAKELIMTGRNFDTDLAEAWAIVNHVAPKDEILAKAEAFAAEISLSAPMAVSFSKRVINDIIDNGRDLKTEAYAQAQLIQSEDFENGVRAMITKTYPVEWKGR